MNAGLPYCSRDYNRLFAPRCTVCSVPMTSWVVMDSSIASTRGNGTNVRTAIDDGSSLGLSEGSLSERGTMDSIKVCRRCSKEAPSCFSCGQFSRPSESNTPQAKTNKHRSGGSGGSSSGRGGGRGGGSGGGSGGDSVSSTSPTGFTDLPDGRTSCPACASTAVHRTEDAKALFEEVKVFFASRGFQSFSGGANGGANGGIGGNEGQGGDEADSSPFDRIRVRLCDRSKYVCTRDATDCSEYSGPRMADSSRDERND